jgi:O-antigen ligase
LARVAVTRTLVVRRTPLDLPFLLFLGSAALAWVFAENRNVAWLGTYERYDGLLTLLTYAALFWLAAQSIADRDEARALVRVVLASGYAVAAAAIVQSLHDSIEQGTFVQAFGTMANPNVLGAFLALVIAAAAAELLLATSITAKILLVNVLVVAGLALVLSFSRSSWFATVAAIVFVIAARPRRARALALLTPVVLLTIAVIALGYSVAGNGQLERAFAERARSLLDPSALLETRTGIWGDTLRMAASRPLVGYGPDNVGLVFPRFQTGDWGLTANHVRQPIDKAHAELLQVAVTQGLVGVLTYVLLQLAFLRTLWRARHVDRAIVAGAGWIGYTLVVQLNFTALAAALPFWVFAAVALESCEAVSVTRPIALRGARLLIAPGVVLAAAIAWWGVALSYAADVRLREAVDADFAGHKQEALRLASQARQLAPWESVYAVEVANLAFEQDAWTAAREAYGDAARLGTFNDLVYRNLALADRNLGLTAEARVAARQAVQLDRFDPANQALLAEFGNQP